MVVDSRSTRTAARSQTFEWERTLVRHIERSTCRGVRDLCVTLQPGRVCVTGTSRTYYVKQLVTQAVQTLLPGVDLANEVHVAAA